MSSARCRSTTASPASCAMPTPSSSGSARNPTCSPAPADFRAVVSSEAPPPHPPPQGGRVSDRAGAAASEFGLLPPLRGKVGKGGISARIVWRARLERILPLLVIWPPVLLCALH